MEEEDQRKFIWASVTRDIYVSYNLFDLARVGSVCIVLFISFSTTLNSIPGQKPMNKRMTPWDSIEVKIYRGREM